MKTAARSRLLFFGGVALVVVFDQLVKLWVVRSLPAYTPVNLVPRLAALFSFTFVKNTGVAFGLFPQLGGVFTVLSTVVIAGIFIFRHSIAGATWGEFRARHGAGGALGNLIDRFTRGFVVDFRCQLPALHNSGL